MFKLRKKESKNLIGLVNYLRVTELKIRGNNYFIKPDDKLKEVIGYYLAKSFGLNCIEYSSVLVGNKRYSISRDIEELYPFVIASNFIKSENNLLEIIDLVSKSKYYNEELIFDILKMYVFDILFLNDDRNKTNWGIIFKKNKYSLIVFDNSNIFSVLNGPQIQFNSKVNYNMSLSDSIIKDLELFLNYCSNEYYQRLEDLIYKFNIEIIEKIFKNIESMYNVELDSLFLEIYERNYMKILDILNKKRGITR